MRSSSHWLNRRCIKIVLYDKSTSARISLAVPVLLAFNFHRFQKKFLNVYCVPYCHICKDFFVGKAFQFCLFYLFRILIHWERRGSRIPRSLGRVLSEPSSGFHIFLDLINKDSLETESRATIILINGILSTKA